MDYFKDLSERPLYASIIVFTGVLLFLYYRAGDDMFYMNENGQVDFKGYGVGKTKTMFSAGVVAWIIAFYVYIALTMIHKRAGYVVV